MIWIVIDELDGTELIASTFFTKNVSTTKTTMDKIDDTTTTKTKKTMDKVDDTTMDKVDDTTTTMLRHNTWITSLLVGKRNGRNWKLILLRKLLFLFSSETTTTVTAAATTTTTTATPTCESLWTCERRRRVERINDVVRRRRSRIKCFEAHASKLAHSLKKVV